MRYVVYMHPNDRNRLLYCRSISDIERLKNRYFIYFVTVRAVETDCVVFVGVFFLCWHDNSWTAAVSLMIFRMNMYLDNRTNSVEFQGC